MIKVALEIVFLFALLTVGIFLGKLLAARKFNRLVSLRKGGFLLAFVSYDRGRTWSFRDTPLPASELTDRLQDAFSECLVGDVPGTRRQNLQDAQEASEREGFTLCHRCKLRPVSAGGSMCWWCGI